MKDLQTRINNIKFWRRWLMATCVFLAVIYLPIILGTVFPTSKEIISGIFGSIPDNIRIFIIMIFVFGPYLSLFLLALGLAGLANQAVRCPACRSKLTVRQLENMNGSFLCPYCQNSNFDEEGGFK